MTCIEFVLYVLQDCILINTLMLDLYTLIFPPTYILDLCFYFLFVCKKNQILIKKIDSGSLNYVNSVSTLDSLWGL
jgi:hypothetical protein